MNEGFILLHRKMLENAIFYKADYYQIWCYILLKVNHKDNEMIWNGEKKIVKKGSGIFSQKKISEDLRISIGTVHNALKYLKSESQIEIKTTTKFTEIKVIKWEDYQDAERILENKMKPKRKQNETNNNDNNDNKKRVAKKFTPPTLEEVKQYFQENGQKQFTAEKAFKFYEAGKWHDSNGKPVQNWKQKMQNVWFAEIAVPEKKEIVGYTIRTEPHTGEFETVIVDVAKVPVYKITPGMVSLNDPRLKDLPTKNYGEL
jgi:hypothetical protein